MIERIIRLFPNEYSLNEYSIETNICLLLMDSYMIFVDIGGIENIYSYLNCLLLANLCLIHCISIIYYCNTNKTTIFHCIWNLEIEFMLSHQN